MGKIFGGSGKQTQTSTSAPWKEAQPYLKDIYAEAQSLYDKGTPDFWGGTALAGLTPEMQTAMGAIWNRASAGNPLLPGAQASTDLIASGGAYGMNPAYDFLTGLVNGPGGNPVTGYATNLMNTAGTNPALQYLTAEASGANLGNNPFLDAMYQRGAGQLTDTFRKTTVPALQSDYALSGRYGSNAMKTALQDQQSRAVDAASDLATKIYGGAYESDRSRQAQAAQGLTGAYAQDIASRIGAGQFLSGIYDTDLQRKLYGSQQLGQLGQQDIGNILQASGMAPALGAADYQDLQQLLAMGQYGQDRTQAEHDLERQRFEYGENAPYDWLAKYANLIYANPGSSGYGTQTTTQKSGGGGFGSILGGILGLGSTVLGMPGVGAGVSAMFSDRRVKTGARKVGTLDNKLPVYLYRYKWGGPPMIGVMAQDVEKVNPDAVDSVWGIKTVDYEKAVSSPANSNTARKRA